MNLNVIYEDNSLDITSWWYDITEDTDAKTFFICPLNNSTLNVLGRKIFIWCSVSKTLLYEWIRLLLIPLIPALFPHITLCDLPLSPAVCLSLCPSLWVSLLPWTCSVTRGSPFSGLLINSPQQTLELLTWVIFFNNVLAKYNLLVHRHKIYTVFTNYSTGIIQLTMLSHSFSL